jgi:hypothetical protein
MKALRIMHAGEENVKRTWSPLQNPPGTNRQEREGPSHGTTM